MPGDTLIPVALQVGEPALFRLGFALLGLRRAGAAFLPLGVKLLFLRRRLDVILEILRQCVQHDERGFGAGKSIFAAQRKELIDVVVGTRRELRNAFRRPCTGERATGLGVGFFERDRFGKEAVSEIETDDRRVCRESAEGDDASGRHLSDALREVDALADDAGKEPRWRKDFTENRLLRGGGEIEHASSTGEPQAFTILFSTRNERQGIKGDFLGGGGERIHAVSEEKG